MRELTKEEADGRVKCSGVGSDLHLGGSSKAMARVGVSNKK
jgi:hypothetical protein